jgi:Secretion system C-terminal sorting domain
MKHLYIYFVLSCLFIKLSSSTAQTFSVPHDTVYATVRGASIIHDDITNTTATQFKLRWHVLATDFPADWLTPTAFGICDNLTCLANSGDTLLWRTATSTSGSNFLSDFYMPSVPGLFDLNLDLSAATTLGSHWVTIAITDPGSFYTKNITFVINKLPLGIKELQNTGAELTIYPNPARNDLNVVYDDLEDVKSIVLYNIIGKAVKVYRVNTTSANLNLENVPSGIYFLRLFDSKGSLLVTRKFTRE